MNFWIWLTKANLNFVSSEGTKQNGEELGDIILPPWAKGDAIEFIRLHREVSKQKKWIQSTSLFNPCIGSRAEPSRVRFRPIGNV